MATNEIINELIAHHGQTYNNLLGYYQKSKQKLQNTREIIIQKILNNVPKSSKVLDVGCNIGANLEIMKQLGFNQLKGIDISTKMIQTSRDLLPSIEFECIDVHDLSPNNTFDIVIAQAFIHLYPVEHVEKVLLPLLLRLTSNRLYLSTTIHALSSEGFRNKTEVNVSRYRHCYTYEEISNLIKIVVGKVNNWSVEEFIMVDPYGKTWINYIFQLNNPLLINYKQKGYASLGQILSDHQIEQIKDFAEECESNKPHPNSSLMRYFDEERIDRIENFIYDQQWLRILFTDSTLLNRIDQVFERPVTLFKDKLNYKPPGKGEFPAHQDAAADWEKWGNNPDHITLAVCIDPVTEENGMLEFAPGKHTQGLLSEKRTPLSQATTNNLKWEKIYMKPGEGFVFSSFAPHRSGPNLSSSYRRMIFITYSDASRGNYTQEFFKDKRLRQPPKDDWKTGVNYTKDAFGKYIPANKISAHL